MSSSVQRLLELRKIDGFEDAELSDLATLAENVRERAFAAGALVAAALSSTASIHIVLEGRLTATSGRSWGPGEVCGSLEAMGRGRMSEDVFAEAATRTLELSAAAFREILEDNYGLLTSVRRALVRQLDELPQGRAMVQLPELVNDQALGMVERLMLLRKRMPFGKGRIEALAALAQAAEEIRVPAATVLGVVGEASVGTLVLLEGTARVTGHGQTFEVGPGYAIGALEVLAERPFASTIVALTPIRALLCPSAAMFDVLEDHTDLALAMIETLAATLVAVARERAHLN